MYNLLRSELGKIFNKKSLTKIFLVNLIFLSLMLSFYLFQSNPSYLIKNIATPVNSLNLHIAIFSNGFMLFFVFVLLPIITLTLFSEEINNGYYRMYLTKGFKKYKFLFCKWISLILCTIIILLFDLVLIYISSFMFFSPTTDTIFHGMQNSFSHLDCFFYNIKFYFLTFIISIIIILLISLISMLVKKTILAYFTFIGVFIGSLYLYKPLGEVLIDPTSFISELLSKTYNINIIAILILLAITSILFNIIIWEKRDWIE